MFARQLPAGRRYGVVAGTGRFLDALVRFTLRRPRSTTCAARGVVDEPTARLPGVVPVRRQHLGLRGGRLLLPGLADPGRRGHVRRGGRARDAGAVDLQPRLRGRVAGVADGDGGRQPAAHRDGLPAHARARGRGRGPGRVPGRLRATSNLRAGCDYGVPTTGTSAHAFTLVHDDERDAFAAQVEALGAGTTLLVDTYDVARACGPRWRWPARASEPSGSTAVTSPRSPARSGLSSTPRGRRHQDRRHRRPGRALHRRARLGPGRRLRRRHRAGHRLGRADRGAGLQARRQGGRRPGELRPVAKRSVGKPTIGGRKWAVRTLTEAGTAVAEVISTSPPAEGGDQAGRHRVLLRQLVRDGEIVGDEPLAAARDRHRQALAELPREALRLSPATGDPDRHLRGNGRNRRLRSGHFRAGARPEWASRTVAFLPCIQAHDTSARFCARWAPPGRSGSYPSPRRRRPPRPLSSAARSGRSRTA